jgi:hypothetical protein
LKSQAPGFVASLSEAGQGRARGSAPVNQRNNSKPRPHDLVNHETAGLRLYAQLGLRLPAELALRLKRYCQESGKSANKAVTEALAQYLGENQR